MNTNKINSNFYQIAITDPNDQVVGIKISNIANLKIDGGSPGQVLTTDGTGNLYWGPGGGGGGVFQPAIEWKPTVSGTNVFVDANLSNFIDGTYAEVYIDGILQEIGNYTIVGNTLQFTGNAPPISNTTVVTVGPTGAGGGTVTNIATTQVDPSGLGFTLTGGPITSTGTVILNVPNANVLLTSLGIPNIANVANYPALPSPPDGNTYLAGDGTWKPSSLLNTKKYIMAHGGGLPPGIYPANTVLVFDTVDIASGITYNTTTGILTLTTPGSYRLTATMQSTVNGTQFSSGDISFIWHYGNGGAVYPGTFVTADSYGLGSTYVGSQATNEIIVSISTQTQYKVVTYYPMNSMLYDVNYVRLIAQQL